MNILSKDINKTEQTKDQSIKPYPFIVNQNFLSKIQQCFLTINDNSYGSVFNPITDKKNDAVQGYGWAGKEIILEELIILLASYSSLSSHRQIPVQNYVSTAKAQNRRLDLAFLDHNNYRKGFVSGQLYAKKLSKLEKNSFLTAGRKRSSEVKKASPIIITELKSNYISYEDITDICLTRRYPELAYKKYSFQEDQLLIFQFVSPAGITNEAVKELNIVQKILSTEKEMPNIVLRISKLEYFVNHQLKPVIKDNYQNRGNQYQYVQKEIDFLAWKLCNPDKWLDNYWENRKAMIKAFNEECNSNS